MTIISKAVALVAISAALTLSGSHVFAKTRVIPGQASTSGASAAPSSASGSQSKLPWQCWRNHCPQPGTTQPTCLGPHRGPNGVLIQCD